MNVWCLELGLLICIHHNIKVFTTFFLTITQFIPSFIYSFFNSFLLFFLVNLLLYFTSQSTYCNVFERKLTCTHKKLDTIPNHLNCAAPTLSTAPLCCSGSHSVALKYISWYMLHVKLVAFSNYCLKHQLCFLLSLGHDEK